MEAKSSDAFVSGALGLILRVSRFAGVAPLRFVKQRGGWRVSLSPCCSVYGYVLVTVMNSITITTLIMDFLLEPAQSIRMRTSTRRVVWILDAAILMTLAFVGAAEAPERIKSMISCLNLLQKINNELNIPHWPKRSEMKKCILFILGMLVTIALTLADHVLITMLIEKQHGNTTLSIMYLFYYGCYWITQLIIFQFVIITLHICRSFKEVNYKLRKLSQTMSDSKQLPLKSSLIQGISASYKKRDKSVNTVIDSLAFAGKVKPVDENSTGLAHETVRRLALTYVSTCDLMREVDKRHGVMLLLLLGSFLLHMSVTPYYLINNIFENNRQQNTVNMILQILWCIFHSANLVMLIEPCHLTLEEIDTTREQISHLMRHTSSFNEPLAIELDLFFRHIVLNQVSYSPLKVTTLTRGLVATILGSITTYLVIIIQL